MTIDIKNLSLVENAKTVPLHFTLELEGLRDQGTKEVLMVEQIHMESYMACNEFVSWSTRFCIKPTSKKWVFHKIK